MIQGKILLSKTDRIWIKFAKGHFKGKYPSKGGWIETAKPLWTEQYAWDPDEDNNYHDYIRGLFNRLLELWMKIEDDQSGSNIQLREIFAASFAKSISREQELPIERAISCLFGLIQNNLVVDKGVNRYELD